MCPNKQPAHGRSRGKTTKTPRYWIEYGNGTSVNVLTFNTKRRANQRFDELTRCHTSVTLYP